MGDGYYRTRSHKSLEVPVEEGDRIQSWPAARLMAMLGSKA